MIRNEKGFTLIELFAVIALVSLVILPTLTALTGNFRVNILMMDRSTASLKSTQTIEGFQGLYFTDINNKINEDTPYLLFTRDQGCSDLIIAGFRPINDIVRYESNQVSCQKIFDTKVNDVEFDAETMQVYIYPYAVDDRDAWLDSIDPTEMPPEVYEQMERITEGQSIRVLRIIVWIQYSDDRNITRPGLIAPRVEVSSE